MPRYLVVRRVPKLGKVGSVLFEISFVRMLSRHFKLYQPRWIRNQFFSDKVLESDLRGVAVINVAAHRA